MMIRLAVATGVLVAPIFLAAPTHAADAAWAEEFFVNGGDMPACGVCHTLAAAGTAGQIGPVLDDLEPSVQQVRAAVSDGVGVMPSYSNALSDEKIQAMAEYVAEAVE